MTALNWVADWRGAAGPVTDQGLRPTCLSCAISSAHHQVLGSAACIEYLHYGSRRLPTGVGSLLSVQSVLGVDGQPDETAWPYDISIDETVVSPIPPRPLAGPFHRADLAIDVDPQRDSLIQHLENDRLPVIGLRTTPGFMNLRSGVLTEPGPHVDGHAVVLVGAATYEGPDLGVIQPGDQLMCVQNSWGLGWGVDGYGLIGPRAWDDMVLVSAHLVPR